MGKAPFPKMDERREARIKRAIELMDDAVLAHKQAAEAWEKVSKAMRAVIEQWDEEDVQDNLWETAPVISDEDNSLNYHDLADKLTGKEADPVDWARKQHAESNGPAKDIPYRILAGEVDKLVGEHGHRFVLGILVGRHVDKTNPPGEKLVRFLLALIQAEIDVLDERGEAVKDKNGRKLKKNNPKYNEAVVESLKRIRHNFNPKLIPDD